MYKCKRCNGRVPKYFKDEYDMHDSLCRKCYKIETSDYKGMTANIGKRKEEGENKDD